MFFNIPAQPLWLKIMIALLAAILGIASYKYFNLPPNNEVEECAEYVIKAETGMDIDLTFTPKK